MQDKRCGCGVCAAALQCCRLVSTGVDRHAGACLSAVACVFRCMCAHMYCINDHNTRRCNYVILQCTAAQRVAGSKPATCLLMAILCS
jgi:hypothetical protein